MRNPFQLKKKNPAWGENDTLGAANRLSPEGVVKAAELIQTGKTYPLGVVVHRDFPAPNERRFEVRTEATGPDSSKNNATWHETLTSGSQGFGTHIDSLGHFGEANHYYNGNTAEEIYSPLGLQKLGVDEIPPIVTRGVLLDMAAFYSQRVVSLGTAFSRADLETVCEEQNIEINAGDVVLLHTGLLSLANGDPQTFLEGAPGLSKEGAEYLADLGVVAVGADTWSLEVVPWENEKEFAPVHGRLLAHHGIYILENVDTSALAEDKVHEFFFTLGTPRLKGAGEAMVNPIAIV